MRDIKKLTSSLALAGVHAIGVETPSRSHLGGDPNLPESIKWPEWRDKRLDFLARISLPELQQAHRIEWLPQAGALLFFYDAEEQPWGFDPAERGSCAVLHVPDLEGPLSGSSGEYFAHKNIAFHAIAALPSSDRSQVNQLSLSDAEVEEYWQLRDNLYAGLPKHQLGGFPSPVQSDDMEMQSQLVTHGWYCGDSTEFDNPLAQKLKVGAKDWRLLLQLDTDTDGDFMWGDMGMLYFWVREQEAAAGRFENVWCILQCG